MPREWNSFDENKTNDYLQPREGRIYSFNSTKYLGVKITTNTRPSPYDLTKNGVRLMVDDEMFVLRKVNCDENLENFHCDFDLARLFQNVTQLKIENLCEFISIDVQIQIYEVTCKDSL